MSPGPNSLVCVSPQLLFDAMALMIHHDVAGTPSLADGQHSNAERRDLAVVHCINRLLDILHHESASDDKFKSLQHGYVEAAWLQRLWPQPDAEESRLGALHLLRMLAQAQLCYPLDDSQERFQFSSLLPAESTFPAARLGAVSQSLLAGAAGAAGCRLIRADADPPTREPSSLDTLEGCARLLTEELEAAGNLIATQEAVEAVFHGLDSVHQFIGMTEDDVLVGLQAAQLSLEHENMACDAVVQLQRRIHQHKGAQPIPSPVPTSIFPPDFIHHLQMHVVRQATSLERLQEVVLWRDGFLFPINIITDWPSEVVVQVEMHSGVLSLLVLLGHGEVPTPANLDQALPVVLKQLVDLVRDSGNFAGLRWAVQMLNGRQLLAAVQQKYHKPQGSVLVGLEPRLVRTAPIVPLPTVPATSTPAAPPVDIPLSLLLQRCGLGPLWDSITNTKACSVESFMKGWDEVKDQGDASLFTTAICDTLDERVERFLSHRLTFDFVTGIFELCKTVDQEDLPALDSALAVCGLEDLRRVFVDVLAWRSPATCRDALKLLRQMGREALGTEGTFGDSAGARPWQLFLSLLPMNELQRSLFAKLLQCDTTLAVLVNAAAADGEVGTAVQADAEALCSALCQDSRVFPAAITHCLPILQPMRSADVAALCTAVRFFFKPKVALVWFGGHGSTQDQSALCFHEGDPMTAAELRQSLQALNATTTLLFLHSCFGQRVIHDHLVFEGLVAFAFAAKNSLIAPGVTREVLAKLLRAGHACDKVSCAACSALHERCKSRCWVTVADMIAYLQSHRAQPDAHATHVVSSLPHFDVPVWPFVDK